MRSRARCFFACLRRSQLLPEEKETRFEWLIAEGLRFGQQDLILVTANLLATFRPREKHWWEYLDQIWDAAEAAERTSLTVLPALMLPARKESASQGDDVS